MHGSRIHSGLSWLLERIHVWHVLGSKQNLLAPRPAAYPELFTNQLVQFLTFGCVSLLPILKFYLKDTNMLEAVGGINTGEVHEVKMDPSKSEKEIEKD